jgi:S-adenosylmethionine:tRNA ribosyltransferase-isomerase
MLALRSDSFLLTEDFDYDLPEGLIATHPAQVRDASRLLILNRIDGQHNHCFFRELPFLLRPRSLLVLNDTRVLPARLFARKPSGGRVEVLLVERVPRNEHMGADRVGEGGLCPPTSSVLRDPTTTPFPSRPPATTLAPPPERARPSEASGQAGGREEPRVWEPSQGSHWDETWRVLVRGLGRVSPGVRLHFAAPIAAEVRERGGRGAAVVRFSGRGPGGLLAAIADMGEVPLPPYIVAARRHAAVPPAVDDRERYQTVYADAAGAVAAPTAGLHFTRELLAAIAAAGHELARITLHVGPGTFRPVSASDPTRHRLEPERFVVGEAAAASIRGAQAAGRPIVAVGTTVVRTLETLARRGPIAATAGSTDLFILPGEEFRVVTDLITNFHLPRSSLLMLVAAFAGRERVLAAYAEAIAAGYRFYSYGDAMFIRQDGSIP